MSGSGDRESIRKPSCRLRGTGAQRDAILKALRMYAAARKNDWATLCKDLMRRPEPPRDIGFDEGLAYDEAVRLLGLAGQTANRDGYAMSPNCADAERLFAILEGNGGNGLDVALPYGDVATLQDALEEYFRIRYGQWSDFADAIARNGYAYDKANPRNRIGFDKFIQRRNAAQPLPEAAGRAAVPFSRTKTRDCCLAEDIWATVRHFLYRTEHPDGLRTADDSRALPPILISGEPAIRICLISDARGQSETGIP